MLSRRSFLKISGFAAAALSAGYGAGRLAGNSRDDCFAIHGFIPADENILNQLITSFTDRVNPSSDPVIFADSEHTSLIKEIYSRRNRRTEEGSVKIRLTRINSPAQSDILVSENNSAVLDPDFFNTTLMMLRTEVKNRRAEYFVSAEFRQKGILQSLLSTNSLAAVIENEKGLVDRIDLNKSYSNILVNGKAGKTGISLSNRSIKVHNAACRNHLCIHTGSISEPGQIIACAPNKVLIRIEAA